MTTIITRSALVHWGRNPPPDVAAIVDDYRGRHIVTWAEVMDNRRRQQRDRMKEIRHVPQVRAARIYVAYFDQRLMGGWQAFIDSLTEHAWIDRDRSFLIPILMELFPLVEPTLDFGTGRRGHHHGGGDEWESWKVEFARRFQRGTQDGKPRGVAFVWWGGGRNIVRTEGGGR